MVTLVPGSRPSVSMGVTRSRPPSSARRSSISATPASSSPAVARTRHGAGSTLRNDGTLTEPVIPVPDRSPAIDPEAFTVELCKRVSRRSPSGDGTARRANPDPVELLSIANRDDGQRWSADSATPTSPGSALPTPTARGSRVSTTSPASRTPRHRTRRSALSRRRLGDRRSPGGTAGHRRRSSCRSRRRSPDHDLARDADRTERPRNRGARARAPCRRLALGRRTSPHAGIGGDYAVPLLVRRRCPSNSMTRWAARSSTRAAPAR